MPDGCHPGSLDDMSKIERKNGNDGEGSVNEDVGKVNGDNWEQETGQG